MANDMLQPIVDGQTYERVLLHGDLKQLTATQKSAYYLKVCETVGLNPLTQPFAYLVLNGREILYARREATEQLRKLHKVSLTIVSRELVEGTFIVTCRATTPDGRTDESIGAKWLGDLKGEVRANGIMTAETKSKRRVTLSICGLGMLDETEVSDIPPAAMALPPDTTAFGTGLHYATDAAPPPRPDEPALATGYVRIERVDSTPTKNPNVTKYLITLSTGEELSTINQFVAAIAQTVCEDRTPVKVTTKKTKRGSDVVRIDTQDQAETPAEPLPLDDDIPF